MEAMARLQEKAKRAPRKVVFPDGTPLTSGGIVLFDSMAPGDQPVNARGRIQADGTFRLSTFDEGDGAVAGKHRVLVRAQRDSAVFRKTGRVPKPVIDSRFEHYETSCLEVTVKDGDNELTIVVEVPGIGERIAIGVAPACSHHDRTALGDGVGTSRIHARRVVRG